MARDKPQADVLHKHPEPYQDDLNPQAMAGQNLGVPEAQPSKHAPTAYDLKPVHERFKSFADDELKQLRVLPVGSRLEQGATYIDLNNLDLGEFTAMGDMQVGRGNWLVAKKDVHYELWNRLLGVEPSERQGVTE
jgi:hypothetical protein